VSDDLPDVPSLRTIDPPPNGLAVLRSRLDQRRRPWWLLAVPALAIAIAILFLRTRSDAVAPAPVTALPDPTVGENFYWVASTPSAPKAQAAPLSIPSTVSITDAPGVTYRSP
jgi:hypothetical protein